MYSGLSYKVRIHWRQLSAPFLPYSTLTGRPPTLQSKKQSSCGWKGKRGKDEGRAVQEGLANSVNRSCPSPCSALGHNILHSQKQIRGKCLWLAESRVSHQVIRGFLLSAMFFFLLKKHLAVSLNIRLEGLHMNIRFLGYARWYVGYAHTAALETQCR